MKNLTDKSPEKTLFILAPENNTNDQVKQPYSKTLKLRFTFNKATPLNIHFLPEDFEI